MTDSIPDDADRPAVTTDAHGDLEQERDPATQAQVRDEQQIVDLQGGEAGGGAPD